MLGLFRRLNDIFERRTKQQLLVAAAGSVLIGLMDTFAIALVLPLVDLTTGRGNASGPVRTVANLLGTHDRHTLSIWLTGLVVGLFVLKDLGSMWFSWWLGGFISRERVLTSARLLDYYLRAPYTEMSSRSSAELMTTMDYSVLQLFSLTINGLMNALSSAIAIGLVVVTLLVLAPIPTGVLIVYFSVAAVGYLRLIKPRTNAAGKLLNASSIRGWRAAFAALGAMKEVNLRGSQAFFVDGYRDAQLQGAHAGRLAGFISGLPKYILEIFFIVAVGLVLLVNASTESQSSAALGLIALFVAAGFRLLPAVTALVSNASSIRLGADSLDVVQAELANARRLPREASSRTSGSRMRIADQLEAADVGFRYPGAEADVLRSISFELPKGSSLALVGTSGAGKTTLVDMVLGLHRPTQGAILVDGVDIAHDRPAWRQSVGYVPQEIYILETTLAENIAFDCPREAIDAAQLERVIRQAQLEELVAELPNGVDTWLGERGTRLSGGQRQRVGIARALYREPDLLVFDEATSALDNETEHRISQTIEALRHEMTIIIVAHRLSTVRHADQVAFMKDGRIVSIGTFDEVRAENHEFARLVELGSLDALEER